MNYYLVKVKITFGNVYQDQTLLLKAANAHHADYEAYRWLKRGPLESSDSGFFDMGGGIHLEVKSTQEVAPEHLPILQHYLEGRPLPTQTDYWHVSWEIELDKEAAATAHEAGIEVAQFAIEQFERLMGKENDATKPALTINGQLIDFEMED